MSDNYIHKSILKDGTEVFFRELEERDILPVAILHKKTFDENHWGSNGLIPNPVINKETGQTFKDYMSSKFYICYWNKFYKRTKPPYSRFFATIAEVYDERGDMKIISFSKNELYRGRRARIKGEMHNIKQARISKEKPKIIGGKRRFIANFQSQYTLKEYRGLGLGRIQNGVRAMLFREKYGEECDTGFTLAAQRNKSSQTYMKKSGGEYAGDYDFSLKDIYGATFDDANKLKVRLSVFVYHNIKNMEKVLAQGTNNKYIKNNMLAKAVSYFR